jgi:hypothetical protein
MLVLASESCSDLPPYTSTLLAWSRRELIDTNISRYCFVNGIKNEGLKKDCLEFVDHVFSCIKDVKLDKDPGNPWSQLGNDKGQILRDTMSTFFELLISRIYVLLDPELPNDPEDLLKEYYTDPILVTLKGEPHKEEKVKSGRLRIISIIGTLNGLLERILFSYFNKACLEMNSILHWKPGMGLHDEGMERIFEFVSQMKQPICSTDVSAWDWSVPEWLRISSMNTRLKIHGASQEGIYRRLVKNYYHAMNRGVFITPGGIMYKQLLPGIMKSGTYNTSSDNSIDRGNLKRMANPTKIVTIKDRIYDFANMGDDLIEGYVPGLQQVYSDLGFTVKGVEVMGSKFSFCSTTFDGSPHGVPENLDKMLHAFLVSYPRTTENRRAMVVGLKFALRHHENLTSIINKLREWTVKRGLPFEE